MSFETFQRNHDAVRQGEIDFTAAVLRGDGSSDRQRAAAADFNRKLRTGQTAAEAAASEAQRAGEAFRARALRDYDDGEPPASIKADTKGMKPMRARLARFLVWMRSTADELANLEAVRARLEATIEAPVAAEANRRGLLQEQAARLLEAITSFGQREAGSPGFDVVQRRSIDAEIDAAAHKADVARVALNDVSDKIAIKQIQLERLRERQPNFVEDAVREAANEMVPEYLEAIATVRPILKKLFGMRAYLDLTGTVKHVEFPLFGLPALADSEDARTIVPGPDAGKPWRDLVKSWGVL